MGTGRRWLLILLLVGGVVVLYRAISGPADDDGVPDAATTTAAAAAASTTTEARLTTTSTLPTTTTTTRAVTRSGLLQAVEAGLVEAEFRALGGASGDIVELLIRGLSDLPLEITVPVGLMLENAAGGEQDLVVAGLEGLMTGSSSYQPADEILLEDDSLRTYLLEAYCAEAHDANPSDGGSLSLGAVAGADLVAVLRAVVEEGVAGNTVLVQAVIWVITDDVSAADLDAVGYGLEEGELAEARAVIAAAGLDPEAYRLFGG